MDKEVSPERILEAALALILQGIGPEKKEA